VLQCWGGSCTATPGATVQPSRQRRSPIHGRRSTRGLAGGLARRAAAPRFAGTKLGGSASAKRRVGWKNCSVTTTCLPGREAVVNAGFQATFRAVGHEMSNPEGASLIAQQNPSSLPRRRPAWKHRGSGQGILIGAPLSQRVGSRKKKQAGALFVHVNKIEPVPFRVFIARTSGSLHRGRRRFSRSRSRVDCTDPVTTGFYFLTELLRCLLVGRLRLHYRDLTSAVVPSSEEIATPHIRGLPRVTGPTIGENRPACQSVLDVAIRYGYDSKWARFARTYKRLHPLCVVCELEGRTTLTDVPHHLEPVADGGELYPGDEGLLPVCNRVPPKG
jgi:hypothetical protein